MSVRGAPPPALSLIMSISWPQLSEQVGLTSGSSAFGDVFKVRVLKKGYSEKHKLRKNDCVCLCVGGCATDPGGGTA